MAQRKTRNKQWYSIGRQQNKQGARRRTNQHSTILVTCVDATGNCVEKDTQQAMMWYRKAAEQGLANVPDTPGIVYVTGEGAERDLNQAARWFQKAVASQGDAKARYRLMKVYEEIKRRM